MKSNHYKYLTYIAMLYVSTFLISNVLASKIIHLGVFDLPAAVIVYPLIFILDDILAEIYGYQHTRPIIWFALLCSFIQVLFFQASIAIPAIPEWHFQKAYAQTLGAVPRIAIAGLIAIACSQFSNAYVLAKLKIKLQGQYLAARLVASTFIGVSVDTFIFISLAFYGQLPLHIIALMIIGQIIVKVSYEILMLPVIIFIIKVLKKREGIDYYDTNTNFNPFSRR